MKKATIIVRREFGLKFLSYELPTDNLLHCTVDKLPTVVIYGGTRDHQRVRKSLGRDAFIKTLALLLVA